ncbi:sodium/glutamate symporter [uncultured Anaerococcus sp.]|uniref:sodium/glutamate symporter n=1 Tax=uncultured Anaerococcus sp. TaxID=293428 RepID=UPI0026386FE1|nr:sodium/glutamate symporter [uncultured Anaerococcus sp.]
MKLLLDFMYLSLFLFLGWFIREKIKILQKLFIPASVIGGILLLIMGPQILNIVHISDEVSKYPSFLIIIILTCLVFGSDLNVKRARSYADYAFVASATYGAQLFFGVIVGVILSKIWGGLPPNWGIASIYSFFAGHGAAGSAAQLFTEGGYPDFMGISMIIATIGLIGALSIGMPVVNWGIRKGYTEFVDKPEKLPDDYFGGVKPIEKQVPIGKVKTSMAGINPIALQMTFIALCIMLGYGIRELGTVYISEGFSKINDIVLGIIGAIILWPLMIKTGADQYVDKATVGNISGFALEYLIIAAVGTINSAAMVSYIVPILIYSIVMFAILTPLYIFGCKLLCKDEWFEKMVTMFGQCTGNAATGMTLLRCVDSQGQSAAGDSSGMFLFFFMPIWVGMITLGPSIAMGPNGTIKLLGIGLAIMLVFYGIGFVFKRSIDKK